jgi:hypothetical protein
MASQDQFTQALLRLNGLRAAFFSSIRVLNVNFQRVHVWVLRKRD